LTLHLYHTTDVVLQREEEYNKFCNRKDIMVIEGEALIHNPFQI